MIKINKHIQGLKPSATLAINQKVIALRKEGQEIVHFGFGQSPFPIHSTIIETLQKNASNNNYLPTVGLQDLRIEIANFLECYQGIKVNKDYIYIGPGSKELLFQTIFLMEGTFLIPKGSWVSYGPQIESKNGKYIVLETFLNNDFKLETKTLEQYCSQNNENQKILILNSPNNPTGAVYSNKELKQIAEVCKAYNVIVLSDEIYSQINFNNNYSPSIHKYYPDKTFVFGGLSKVFSAGGYRLGFMTIPKALEYLHSSYRAMFSETFSSVSSPIQYAAQEAYKMNYEIKNQIKNSSIILKEVSSYVYSKLQALKVNCTKPEGAFYMMIGFNQFKNQIHALGIKTSDELSNYILEKFKVALLPATDFYFMQEEFFFRLAFVDFDGEQALKIVNQGLSIENPLINNCFLNIFKGVNQIEAFVNSLSTNN